MKLTILNSNSTTGNYSCIVVIIPSDSIDNKNKVPLIHLENNEKSNESLDQIKNPKNNRLKRKDSNKLNKEAVEKENNGGNNNNFREKKEKGDKRKENDRKQKQWSRGVL